MQRPITGFGVDDAGDPYAVLSCGHRQHVRHRPPFTNRPWVTTAEGRRGKLDALLDCVRCDRHELPEDFQHYMSTPVFDQDSIPQGLRRDHTTRAGVWGRIVVEEGTLHYHVRDAREPVLLAPGTPGIVLPEVAHRVAAGGPVRFRVEFWRAPRT